MVPVVRKVKSSTAGAAAAGVVVFLLGRYVLHGNVDPVVQAEIYAAAPAVLAFAAGYLTPSQPRPPSPSGRREFLPSLPEPPGAAQEKLAPPAT